MSERGPKQATLGWRRITRPDGLVLEEAPARNNSWYLLVAEPPGAYTLRYASQSANTVVARDLTHDEACAEAERHADRYDNRA